MVENSIAALIAYVLMLVTDEASLPSRQQAVCISESESRPPDKNISRPIMMFTEDAGRSSGAPPVRKPPSLLP